MALDFPTERFTRNGDGSQKPVAVLGGGPAGLTAGYLLAQKGCPVIVLEAEDQVGGIAKTEVRDGYRFDLGGHRFFTKSKEVDDLWHEVMKEEFLKRPRMSRIYWNGKFLDYPLRGTDVLRKLGPVEVTRAGLSALAMKTAWSGFHSMTSIFSSLSSRTMDWMRTPRMPTHAPTGSTPSWMAATATLERWPGSRAMDLISTAPL